MPNDPRERATARLQLRLTPSGAALLERAAALSGLSLSEIALTGAKVVIKAETKMRLAADEHEAFLAILRAPSHPTADLRRAVEEHLARVVPDADKP